LSRLDYTTDLLFSKGQEIVEWNSTPTTVAVQVKLRRPLRAWFQVAERGKARRGAVNGFGERIEQIGGTGIRRGAGTRQERSVEWNSTSEIEKAPQGLVSGRGKAALLRHRGKARRGLSTDLGNGLNGFWGVGTGIAERGKARRGRRGRNR